jgi:enolase
MSLFASLAQQFEQPTPTILPTPMMNVINGGEHADNGLAFQECMIIPTRVASFSEAIRAGSEIFHTLKKLLQAAGYTTSVGDEGGFAPNVGDAKEAFDFLLQAIKDSGYQGRVQLGIDAAASEFYNDGTYSVDGKELGSDELTAYYQELVTAYPLISIEDSHDEDDWDGFSALTTALGATHQLVGDDLLVTNVKRIKEAQDKKACNAVLVKVNQIGSVSEAVDAILLAKSYGWNNVISHRSGETEDVFIAHLAVALGAGQIKTGSLSRTDRVCKYNELLRIEEELGDKAVYQGGF